jgi:hypothetical protein
LTTEQIIELVAVALATLIYSFMKFTRSRRTGLAFAIAAFFFAAVSVFCKWTVYGHIWLSIVFAGAPYYGLTLGFFVYGLLCFVFGAAKSDA